MPVFVSLHFFILGCYRMFYFVAFSQHIKNQHILNQLITSASGNLSIEVYEQHIHELGKYSIIVITVSFLHEYQTTQHLLSRK